MTYIHDTVEEILDHYRPYIGSDYERYRNHVYRVFHNCLLLDKNRLHEELYACAAVLHDIGIWTAHTIDYLEPSSEEAKRFLARSGRAALTPEIKAMIYWHHKISAYKGTFRQTVECFRKADWIDVAWGWLYFGADRKPVKALRKILPAKGFHLFLIKKLLKNAGSHPFNPLPMFRR